MVQVEEVIQDRKEDLREEECHPICREAVCHPICRGAVCHQICREVECHQIWVHPEDRQVARTKDLQAVSQDSHHLAANLALATCLETRTH